MKQEHIKTLIELVAEKHGNGKLKELLLEALSFDSDAILLEMEKLATHTLQISRDDVKSVAETLKIHIVQSDVDYIMSNYDEYVETHMPGDIWNVQVEQMLYEYKNL